MPACMCIVHQSYSIDTSNTMPRDPLQILTIDSVTYSKSGILRKGTRPGHLALVLIRIHVVQTCRCCMCKGCSNGHMHGICTKQTIHR